MLFSPDTRATVLMYRPQVFQDTTNLLTAIRLSLGTDEVQPSISLANTFCLTESDHDTRYPKSLMAIRPSFHLPGHIEACLDFEPGMLMDENGCLPAGTRIGV